MDLEAAFDALPGLTEREAQRRMAAAVAEALEAQAPLLVHAPTGVGKSLGYLVPIVAAGRRAIVAPPTKALQSQPVQRALPRLAHALGATSAPPPRWPRLQALPRPRPGARAPAPAGPEWRRWWRRPGWPPPRPRRRPSRGPPWRSGRRRGAASPPPPGSRTTR